MGLLLLLAFGLRLHRLGKPSLWGDEGWSLYRARASWADLLRGRIVLRSLQPIEATDVHPPLYFMALKIWIGLAGDREFALRFPSVFASILMIPVAWAAGRRLREPAAAWAGAILTAASPLYFWYAQEARMYALLALESALLLFLLLPSGRGASLGLRRQIAALMTLLAMILTHYTAFLLVPALGLWALAQPRRDLRRMALWLLIPALLFGSMFPFLYQRLTSGPERDYFFVPLEGILTDVLRASAFGTSFPYADPWS
jgi:mannosyltransferase